MVKLTEPTRQVGEKDSKKKDFAIPSTKKSLLDLNSLALPSKKLPTIPAKSQNRPRISTADSPLKRQIEKDLKDFRQYSAKQLQLLKRSELDFEIEAPQGFDPDELNELELVFYAFKKRIFEQYINALFSSAFEVEKKFPHLLSRELRPEQLTGRVTYDSKGNVIALKVIEWSQDDQVQILFEEALKKLNTIPNPPEDFTRGEEFSIYYRLSIRG